MDFEWDDAKAAANLAKHGVPFDLAHAFDFEAAVIRVDDRRNYGEVREVAHGPIGKRLHVLVFTRRGSAVRVISLRAANRREAIRYLADAKEFDSE
ncbi:BrnT family toxin [Thalassobaculum sp.]|uniref:BrnT family toxin n=1 Tax=Thalassobaculum sp. TaxID=2022740 RepID=UPI0032ED4FF3